MFVVLILYYFWHKCTSFPNEYMKNDNNLNNNWLKDANVRVFNRQIGFECILVLEKYI